jgi:prepilin-type N-terminal cleavage/methylation domain-containing protein
MSAAKGQIMTRIGRSKKGFTLIEVMVAAVAFSLLVVAVGSMLVFGYRGWRRNNDLVNMQRDASLTLMMIAREIRNGTYDDVTVGSGISFAGSGISFTESGDDIIHSGSGMAVVNGWLVPGSLKSRKQEIANGATDFKTNQWVEVEFALATTTETESYSIKASPRNES